ncbi:DC-STAMP domain-containing protein 1, partial [Toxocara canis]
LAIILYCSAWHRVNFADFDPLYKQIFMWSVIFTCALTFALSPVFRCAIVCVLCGALGKNGQGLLSVIVFTHLSDGPVNNIIANFNLSSHIITCHLKLKEQMMTERIVMSTGPIEALLAQKFVGRFMKALEPVTLPNMDVFIWQVFRCAIVCVLCGALGKNGQGLLSVIVFTHLSDGPVNNIIANFNLSSHIITCHLKLKEQMMTERIVMSTGPIEALLAQKFGKSTTKGRKMIHMLKALVEPVAYDLTLSDEDKALAATIDNAEVLQIRDEMLNEKKERKSASSDEHVRPIWDKMKSKSSKLLTMRLRFQCSEIFDKGIKKCHDKFRDMKVTSLVPISSKSTTKGRKMIHMLKALVEPVAYDLTLSDEDKALAATIDNAEVLQIRDEMLNEKKERKSASSDEHVRPIWDKMKSKSSKLLTMRLRFQCSEIFDKGIKKCHDKFRDMKDKCYRLLWYMPFIKRNLCGRFDVLQICQASEKHAEAAKFCDEMMQQTMATTKNFDYDTENMKNITEEVMDHLRINMHYRAIVEPRITRIYRLKQVVYRILHNFRIVKVIFKTLKNLLGCLFILLLYTIFRDSVQMIRRYLNNVDFQNVFLTPYFWHIDKKREEAGQIFLRPLSKAERRVNGLLKPFSFVFAYHQSSLIQLQVMRFSATSVTGQGKQRFHLEVAGTGFVADLVKDMINFEFDRAINLTVPAEHCQAQPIPPDWSFSWKYVLLPLILMLLLQVIFGYFIKRITLFYVIGGIFRKRNKARTIQLYNKLLFGRVNGRRLARARIRYQVERHILQQEAIKERSKFFAGTFIERAINNLFATGKCLLCEMKYRKDVLIKCPSYNCPATYCKTCFAEIHQQCYACLAEEGAVTSLRTQFIPLTMPSEGEAKDVHSSTSVDTTQESN